MTIDILTCEIASLFIFKYLSQRLIINYKSFPKLESTTNLPYVRYLRRGLNPSHLASNQSAFIEELAAIVRPFEDELTNPSGQYLISSPSNSEATIPSDSTLEV